MKRANFEVALKKGEAGEKIIASLLESKGFVVYQPSTIGAHAFDMLAIKDKQRAIAIDVKAKSRRTYYNDTGINQSHFECYKLFSEKHSMPFWLFFIDEYLGKIYGNSIDELEVSIIADDVEYPFVQESNRGKAIRYWSLESMIQVGVIETEVAEKLKEMSQRNYEYPV